MKIQLTKDIIGLNEYRGLDNSNKNKVIGWTVAATILGLPFFILGGVVTGMLTFRYLSKKYTLLNLKDLTSPHAKTAAKVGEAVNPGGAVSDVDAPVVYTIEGMPMTDKRAVGMLYRMQKEWDEACEKFNIRYFACGGTLIGVERQKPQGIVPWDDDIDVALPLGEEKKFDNEAFRQELLSRGLRLRPHWGGYKLTLLECPSFGKLHGEGSQRGEFYWPFIDVFHTYKDKNGKIYINCVGKDEADPETNKTVWPKEYWVEEDFKQTVKVPFGPNQIPVQSKRRREYLKRAFGSDWATTARLCFDHKTGVHFKPEKVVKIQDFSPAPYDDEFYKRPLPQAKNSVRL